MSKKYPGGIIRGTPVVPAGPYQDGAASGIWTLDQATNYIKQGIWPTAGNANPNAFIENLFQTWLYTPASSNINVNVPNGVDLSTYGGMTWIKNRGLGTSTAYHCLVDTVRGGTNVLHSNLTTAAYTANIVSSFNTNGFTTGISTFVSFGGYSFASWTFRKQPKFFDIVTYTGNGTSQNIAHSLGSVPGCIIVKATSYASNWMVYHTSLANTEALFLNLTNAKSTGSSAWNSTTPTSTVFSVGNNGNVNLSGETYVAYLFAHDAGGFGLSGTDNVISCGSFTTDAGGGATVTLGYEPQFLLTKESSTTGNWDMFDSMRGLTVLGANDALLRANLTNAETTTAQAAITATGFEIENKTPLASFIYIAIRRGPMRTPTSGTSVFSPAVSAGATGTKITTDFPLDLQFSHSRSSADIWWWADRLRGMNSPGLSANSPYLSSDNTNAEATSPGVTNAWDNTSFSLGSAFSGQAQAYYNLRRAPGFFDEVCYTGTGSATTQTHNLGVVPEMMIVKSRSSAESYWGVYTSTTGNNKFLGLNVTDAATTNSSFWNNTTPTASVFSIGTIGSVNRSGETYVAYLFASCPGVSKVGSYTGTGTTLQVNCGFTSGARFVLIKRTDSTGDWYVWDSARGIVAGNDPYLLLNNTNAEVTNTDYVDTLNSGFEISSTAPAAINANGGTFIFLAIA